MPSTITLLDVMQRAESNTSRIITKNIVERSPIMGVIPWIITNNSMSYKWYQESALPTSAFRALNGSITDSVGTTLPAVTQLKPLSSTFTIDDELSDITTVEGKQEFLQQLEMSSRAMGLLLKDKFIHGDPNAAAAEPDGLAKWIDDFDSSTNNIKQAYDGTTNGVSLTDAQTIIDQMNSLRNALYTAPSAYLCNRTILSNIQSLVATSTGTGLANIFSMEDVEVAPGIRTQIGRWNGTPMYALDEDATGTEVLAFDETQGSSSLTTSIYAVTFGDQWFSGVMKRASGPRVKQNPSTFGTQWILDNPLNFIMKHKASAGRLHGILAL